MLKLFNKFYQLDKFRLVRTGLITFLGIDKQKKSNSENGNRKIKKGNGRTEKGIRRENKFS